MTGLGAGAEVLLEGRGLARSYGDLVALAPTDLVVWAGERVALLGPNGSGKSTLLRAALRADPGCDGTVTLDGWVLEGEGVRVRSIVATVAEDSACFPDLTVREHLELVARAHGLGRRASAVVTEALDDFALSEREDALPSALSSGQHQALLLASAFVRPRRLVVLDEPEQRLDPRARRHLARRLRREGEDGVAVLFATHLPVLARAVADRVLVLDAGAVVAEGPPAAALEAFGEWDRW